MIFVGTICKVADNSGAVLVKCIKVLKISSRIGAIPGQTITVSVKKNVFKRHIIKKSKIIIKGQICKALILRTKKSIKRWGNFYIKAIKNYVTLLNIYDLPFATRLFGPIFREIRLQLKYYKIISLAVFTI